MKSYKLFLLMTAVTFSWHTTTLADHEPPDIINTPTPILTLITLDKCKTIVSGGSLAILGGGGINTNGHNVIIQSGGTLSVNGDAGLNIQGNSTVVVEDGGTFTIATDRTVNNQGTFVRYPRAIFTNNGTFNNTGAYFFEDEPTVTIPPHLTTILPPQTTLTIPDTQTVHAAGGIQNQSCNTINLYGTLYTFSTIQNGTSPENPAQLNIYFPGKLFLLGGTLENHPTSTVDIHSGGSLYNYYGTVIPEEFFTLKAGGQFHNVRGNNPTGITISAGGNFADTSEVNLDHDLDMDYTWTIRNKATINGFGNEITFGPNGGFVIEKDASLLLEDITINNLSGNKIKCIDTKSTLSLDTVTLKLDADFTLTWGTWYIQGDTIVLGNDKTFSYESDQLLTIENTKILHFHKTIFKYNTTPNNLINMVTSSAGLHLDRATLLAAQPCDLANGTLYTTELATLWGSGGYLNTHNLGSINIDGSIQRIENVST